MQTEPSSGEKCSHCGSVHVGKCPFIRAVEFYKDGKIRRIEYWSLHEMLAFTPSPGKPHLAWSGGEPPGAA
jgi:hypothetical protein